MIIPHGFMPYEDLLNRQTISQSSWALSRCVLKYPENFRAIFKGGDLRKMVIKERIINAQRQTGSYSGCTISLFQRFVVGLYE